MLELTAFLGNPGREYSRNRHNAGFLFAENLGFYSALSWQKKFKGSYASLEKSRIILPQALSGEEPLHYEDKLHDDNKLHFIKPETYMNLSGLSVFQAASFFRIKLNAILVVHDELELPLGTISLKFGGGLGGHNGLRSMKACFGSADFWRLRIGIGRPDQRLPGAGGQEGSGAGIVDWVLSNFSTAETEILDKVMEAGTELFHKALLKDPISLLPEWGKKKIL